MKETELKLHPCYCGGEMKIKKVAQNGGMDGTYWNWELTCSKCGLTKTYAADGFYGRQYKTFEEVVDDWNWNWRREEPDPCNFCSTIYPDTDTQDIVFRRGKYSDINKDSFITIDNERKYHVNIDPGDPYELGYLAYIKFCPYCGRKLAESEVEK